jgi:hypothetical protein
MIQARDFVSRAGLWAVSYLSLSYAFLSESPPLRLSDL